VQAWLVTPGRVLLITRGATRPDDPFAGTVSGVGGKVDDGEDILQALAREVKEEVSIDIDKDDIRSHFVVGQPYPNFTVAWVVVYLLEPQNPIVPAAEAVKIINPRWTDITEVETSLMHPDTASAYRQCLPHFDNPFFRPASSSWVPRDVSKLPPGRCLVRINNKDGLCVPYAIAALTGRTFDWERLAAEVPEQGYKLPDLLPASEWKDWAIFSMDKQRWIVGDPDRAKHELLLITNGDFSHVDGLIKNEGGTGTHYTYFPTGRGATDYDDLPPPEYVEWIVRTSRTLPEGVARVEYFQKKCTDYNEMTVSGRSAHLRNLTILGEIITPEPDIKPTPELEPEPIPAPPPPATGEPLPTLGPTYRDRVLDQSLALRSAFSSGTIDTRHPRGRNADSGNPNLLRYADTSTVALAKDVISGTVAFSDRDAIFTEVEHEYTTVYGSPANGLANLLICLQSDALSRDTIFTDCVPASSASITVRAETVTGAVNLTERTCTLSGPIVHHQTFSPNLVPTSHSSILSKEVKEIGHIFYAQIEASSVSANLIERIHTLDDVEGSNYTPYFDRLLRGMFATQSGCVIRAAGRRPVPAAQAAPPPGADQRFIAMFPNDIGLTDILRVRNGLAAGRLNAAFPVNWPDATVRSANSGVTFFPLRTASAREMPPVVAAAAQAVARDFRVVLFHLCRPYMDLETNGHALAPGLARTRANLERTNCYISDLRAQLPDLVFLSNYNNNYWGNVPYDGAALDNPMSWLDAITFFLRVYGGSGDFLSAWMDVVRRCPRFYPAEQSLTSCDIGVRFRHGDDFVRVVQMRLLHLRIIRPSPSQAPAAALADPDTVRLLKTWNAVDPEGPPIDLTALAGANGAAALRAVQRGYGLPAIAVADLPLGEYPINGPIPPGRIYTHAAWHQYFSMLDISGGWLAGLSDMMAVMPEPDLMQLRAWVLGPFNADFPGAGAPRGAILALGDPTSGVSYPRGRLADAFNHMERVEIIAQGAERRLDHVMPLINMTEDYRFTTPSGHRALRCLVAGQDLFHGDTEALVLADQLAHRGIRDLYFKHLFMTTQLRAGIDAVADMMDLSATLLSAKMGVPLSGSPDIDDWVARSNQSSVFGRLSEFKEEYIANVVRTIAGAGYPINFTSQLLGGLILTFPPLDLWDYNWHTQQRLDTTTCLHIWRTFHPAFISAIRPDVVITGGIINKRPNLFSAWSPGAELIWEDWQISLDTFRPGEPIGALRVFLAGLGTIVALNPIIRVAEAKGNRTAIDYSLATDYARRGPRWPATSTASPALMQEPLWFIHTFIPLLIQSPVDNLLQVDYLRTGWLYQFHFSGRLSSLPSQNHLGHSAIRRFSASPGVAIDSAFTGAFADHAAGTISSSETHLWAGAWYTNANHDPMYTAAGVRADAYDAIGPYLSAQGGSNPDYMRREPALRNYHSVNRAFFNIAVPITGPDGNNFPAILPAGYSDDARDSCLFVVFRGDTWTPGIQLETISRSRFVFSRRWLTMSIELKMIAPPLILSERGANSNIYSYPMLLDGTAPGGLPYGLSVPAQDVKAMARIGAYSAALPYQNEAAITYENVPRIVPRSEQDIRHLITAAKSLQQAGDMWAHRNRQAAQDADRVSAALALQKYAEREKQDFQ
jgi:8-oxo-dGTP pyrophosphatase MutT (NUDIX family)